MTEELTADFWFDPSCSYSWLTSRWLLEVAKTRPVDIRWHVMSLSVLNEGRDDDPEGDPEGYLWVPVRICAAVQQQYGQESLGRLYTAFWTAGHDRGENQWLASLHDALNAADLPPELAEAECPRPTTKPYAPHTPRAWPESAAIPAPPWSP